MFVGNYKGQQPEPSCVRSLSVIHHWMGREGDAPLSEIKGSYPGVRAVAVSAPNKHKGSSSNWLAASLFSFLG